MEDVIIKTEPEDTLNEANINETELFDTNSETMDQEETASQDCMTEINKSLQISDVNYDLLGEFCFESDHLALKANGDYKNLLEAVVVLEAQRRRAINDLDKLLECQEEALADPIAFVEKLQRKENLNLPKSQNIKQLPVIDWGKYALSGNLSAFGRRQLTRLSTKASLDFSRNVSNKSKASLNQQKSSRMHLYWTTEEQKHLEELLIQFPPEEVETRRWEKIANCLENRTPTQVASRVQKYFIKLMKAGIPIPGRTPSMTYLRKPRRNVIRQQPSTFLISHTLPVHMPDADDHFRYNYALPQIIDENSMESRNDFSDEEDIDPELRNTAEFQELVLLKKSLREKLKSCGLAQHIGYKCGRCNSEPIIGVRWHCMECKPAIDFCDDCVESVPEVGQHTTEHRLDAIHNSSCGFLDRDYMHFMGNDYNYLDPNYMPAT